MRGAYSAHVFNWLGLRTGIAAPLNALDRINSPFASRGEWHWMHIATFSAM